MCVGLKEAREDRGERDTSLFLLHVLRLLLGVLDKSFTSNSQVLACVMVHYYLLVRAVPETKGPIPHTSPGVIITLCKATMVLEKASMPGRYVLGYQKKTAFVST